MDFKTETDIKLIELEEIYQSKKCINIENHSIDSEDYHLLKNVYIIGINRETKTINVKLNNSKEVAYKIQNIKILK